MYEELGVETCVKIMSSYYILIFYQSIYIAGINSYYFLFLSPWLSLHRQVVLGIENQYLPSASQVGSGSHKQGDI